LRVTTIELHLDDGLRHVSKLDLTSGVHGLMRFGILGLDLEGHDLLASLSDTTVKGLSRLLPLGRIEGEPHQVPDVASIMARLGEGGRDTARGDLEGIRGLPHSAGIVKAMRDLGGGLRDLVKARSVTVGAVTVDRHAHEATTSGRHNVDAIKFEPDLGHDRFQ